MRASALGQDLRRRRQRGHHGQAGAAQGGIVVVARELRAHQVEEGGIAVARQAGRLGDAQRLRTGARQLVLVDQAGVAELLQHQVAPGQGALRRAARVVVARPLHQAHQQGDVGRLQAGQLAAEVELAGRGEAVYRLPSLLAQEHLVDVGVENAPLVVARFDEQGQQGLVDLAQQVLAAVEEQVLDQLLGQRGAALHHVAGHEVGPGRARDRS